MATAPLVPEGRSPAQGRLPGQGRVRSRGTVLAIDFEEMFPVPSSALADA